MRETDEEEEKEESKRVMIFNGALPNFIQRNEEKLLLKHGRRPFSSASSQVSGRGSLRVSGSIKVKMPRKGEMKELSEL